MPENQLVVAGVPEHFNLPWHLALESGQFDVAGIKITYRDFPGGTGAMTKALADGEVDMAILLAEGAVADLIRRGQTKIVKVYVNSPLIWGIHVSSNSDIEMIDQIQGQRYAVSRFGSGSHLMAIVDAAERGWPTDDLQFEIVKNLDGAREALADGKADIFFWEQFTTQPFVDNGEFRRVGVRKTLWPAFVIAVDEARAQQKGSAIKQTLEIINSQCKSLMENPQAPKIISQRYELELPQVKQWRSLTEWSIDFEKPTAAVDTILKYLNRLEIISAPNAKFEDIWYEL